GQSLKDRTSRCVRAEAVIALNGRVGEPQAGSSLKALPFMYLSVVPFGGAIAEIGGSGVAHERRGLAPASKPAQSPLPLSVEKERRPSFADDGQTGQELARPHSGSNIDPTMMALPPCLKPAVADSGNRQPNGVVLFQNHPRGDP